MARLIDADAFKAYIMDGIADHEDIPPSQFPIVEAAAKGFLLDIDEQPTVSPDEARGVGEITGDDACPSCGCWIPTDDAHDAIFKNEVKFCYYCGMRLRMKGAEDGTTE